MTVCKKWKNLTKKLCSHVEVSYQPTSDPPTEYSLEEANLFMKFAGPLIESVELNFKNELEKGKISITLKKEEDSGDDDRRRNILYKKPDIKKKPDGYKKLIQFQESLGNKEVVDMLCQHTHNLTNAKIKHAKRTTELLKMNQNLKRLELEDCALRKIFDDNFLAASVEELKIYFYSYCQATKFNWVYKL